MISLLVKFIPSLPMGLVCLFGQTQIASDVCNLRLSGLVYLKRNLAKWLLPSFSLTTNIRQVPFQLLLVFQT